MKTTLTTLIGMSRRRAHRHYMAMIRCERAGEWRQADRHYETMVNCERLEMRMVDDAMMSIPRAQRGQARAAIHFGG